MSKVIGIIGSRRSTTEDYVKCRKAFFEIYEEGDTIVSGGCPKGGDKFAEWLARAVGCTITIHHANWEKYGKRAGFVRNDYIARDCDILIAVVASDRMGGAENTISTATKLGKKIILVT